MKKIVITLFLILGSLTIQAQELTWQTTIKKAMEISKKSKKPSKRNILRFIRRRTKNQS